jgi:hypothetical protein
METSNLERIEPTEATDDQGAYLQYHTVCNFRECGIPLTSRNKVTGRRLCKPCSRKKDRIKHANRVRTPAEVAAAHARQDDPRRKELHSLLDGFLNHPDMDAIKQRLLSKLVDAELVFRFRYL